MTPATDAAAAAAARRLADPAVAAALALLDGGGEEARVVGGAVRNTLLGRPGTDVDVATTALPTVVIARAAAAGLRAVPTGISHGTVTLVVDGAPVEVTTLREDVETDGRHAVIRFGRDFRLDALRRDFTVNALSLGADGRVHDYAGGLDDLAARRIRFIGDAATRIREDYLRILRFFRFSAEYADGLDPHGLGAAVEGREGMARLSRERVRQELLKLLVARRAAPVVAAMAERDLLAPLLGGPARPLRLAGLAAVAPGSDAVLRLLALAAAAPGDVERLRDALKLSNRDAARMRAAVEAFAFMPGAPLPDARSAGRRAPDAAEVRSLLFEAGRPAALDALRLGFADSGAPPGDAPWQAALDLAAKLPEPRLPFAAADLLARGMAAGPAVGQALARLRSAWAAAGFPDGAAALAALLDAEAP